MVIKVINLFLNMDKNLIYMKIVILINQIITIKIVKVAHK